MNDIQKAIDETLDFIAGQASYVVLERLGAKEEQEEFNEDIAKKERNRARNRLISLIEQVAKEQKQIDSRTLIGEMEAEIERQPLVTDNLTFNED